MVLNLPLGRGRGDFSESESYNNSHCGRALFFSHGKKCEPWQQTCEQVFHTTKEQYGVGKDGTPTIRCPSLPTIREVVA